MPTATINWTDNNYFNLVTAAKETGMNRSALVNKAVEQYLRELREDQEDYQTAENAWNEHLASGEKTYSLSEVRKDLGL